MDSSKFGFHYDYVVLMVEGRKASHDFCLKIGNISGNRVQVPLNRADAPMSNWQLGMAPGWLCFQLD